MAGNESLDPRVGTRSGGIRQNGRPLVRDPEKGAFARGRCADLSQVVRQICAKLLVFRFVHHTKGAQNCHKCVANSRANFGQIYVYTGIYTGCLAGIGTMKV